MSKTEIISSDITFIDYDSGSEIDVAVAGQKVGIYVPVKNISSSGYIILLHAQLFKDGTLIEDNLIHSEQYVDAGATEEWYSEFYMPDGDALVTSHSYVWPDYPPSSPDYTTMVTLSLGVGWVRADSEIASISPGPGVPPNGWIKADSELATIGVGLPSGWVKADSKTAIVSPPLPPEGIPWEWLLAGGLGLGALILLAPPKKKRKVVKVKT